MLASLEVTSAQPNVPALPLGGFMPNTEAIQIHDIQGLGPVTATIATTGYATGRGEISTGTSIPKRNIVLTLGLNPNWVDQSMASLRQLLYAYFMPESKVHLRFYFTDDFPSVYIDGIVESFEPNMFSNDPEIQISILCLKPDFIDVTTIDLSGPIVSGTPEATIDYPGTMSTGFQLQIQPLTDSFSGDFIVRNTVRGADHDLNINNVTVDDIKYIEMQTMRSLRYLRSVPFDPGEPFASIEAKIGPDSEWPELLPGRNIIQVITSATGLSFTLSYVNRFGGSNDGNGTV